MNPIAMKIIRIIFLGFLPLLLISSASKAAELSTLVLNGTYILDVEENEHHQLLGDIGFSLSTEISSKGTYFNVLKLDFNGNGAVLPHHMEVVVCKENKTDALLSGMYKVKAIESFLNPADGVFGAYSSDVFGEKLYFTKEGSIRITHYSNASVKGTLSLLLVNQKGEIIRVKGSFDAI